MDPGSLILLLLMAGLLFFIISRGRRQQRQVMSVQTQLDPGAEVMTSSGLYATVVALEDAVVVLETAPGQRSRWDRRAIARIVTEAGGSDAAPIEDTEPGPAAEPEPDPTRPEDPERPGRE